MLLQNAGNHLPVYTTLQLEVIKSKDLILYIQWVDSFFHGATTFSGPGPPHYTACEITLRHTTVGRTPLDNWSARRRDLYLTTHNTHKRQTSVPPAGFEPAIPTSEQPQTHALDGAATGISSLVWYFHKITHISIIYFKTLTPANCLWEPKGET